MERIVYTHAQQKPDATAVVDGVFSLTYAELVTEASNLAQRLREEVNISVEEPVGILLSPGMPQVVAQLAVRLAGGSCVPIEPSIPESRIMSILHDV
jgi:non-ribosomal peptide synthetase component F